jgi:hypothetical protein
MPKSAMLWFSSQQALPQAGPIIHRVVRISTDTSGEHLFQTKGDNNMDSIANSCSQGTCIDEYDIHEEQVLGYSLFKVPYLGYIKIWAFELFQSIGGGIKNVLS